MAALLIGGMGLLAAGTAEAAFSDRAKDMAKITGIRIGRAHGNVRVVIYSDPPFVKPQTDQSDPTRIVQ